MPDWFYRTVSRPILFALPAQTARGLALGLMGTLARLPLGGAVIDFLGHMRADERLKRTVLGVEFPSAVGIGPGLDAEAVALPALARFGVGFLEVGPVSVAGDAGARPLVRRSAQEAIWRPDPPACLSLSAAQSALAEVRNRLPLIIRLRPGGTSADQARVEAAHLAEKLAGHLLALDGLDGWGWGVEAWREHVRAAQADLVVVPADLPEDDLGEYVAAAVEAGVRGVVIDGSVRADGGRVYGLPAAALAREQTRRIKRRWPTLALIAAGGVHEPEQALELMEAGADLISTDTGLIYTGPGLPKRINEAVLYATLPDADPPCDLRPPERSWYWLTLMGTGMLLGSLLALLIASTRIVLPYDESFVGMTCRQLAEINPRLPHFLAHDRVSLAGSMVAIAVLYLGLSLGGVRRGGHWAMIAVQASAFVGFATFFLFLGYGYLDPFHAFVTAILFQFLLLSLHSRLGPAPVPRAPTLRGDWRWRTAQWGQLLLVGHAVAMLTGGAVICSFGVTGVFVPEDLAFMRTTAETITSANPRLLPLIAHDRATFGGMLVSAGVVLLCSALWGFRPASRWLWATWLAAGVLGYGVAIAVHWAVGYTDTWHLTPAYGGLGLMLLGLGLSYPFLCEDGATAERWASIRAAHGGGERSEPPQ
jgi:hypothetical protein